MICDNNIQIPSTCTLCSKIPLTLPSSQTCICINQNMIISNNQCIPPAKSQFFSNNLGLQQPIISCRPSNFAMTGHGCIPCNQRNQIPDLVTLMCSCAAGSDPSTQCELCLNGFEQQINKSCLYCPNPLLNTLTNTTVCKCPSGLVKLKNQCRCPSGTVKSGNSCVSCVSLGLTSSCKCGFNLWPNAQFACITCSQRVKFLLPGSVETGQLCVTASQGLQITAADMIVASSCSGTLSKGFCECSSGQVNLQGRCVNFETNAFMTNCKQIAYGSRLECVQFGVPMIVSVLVIGVSSVSCLILVVGIIILIVMGVKGKLRCQCGSKLKHNKKVNVADQEIQQVPECCLVVERGEQILFTADTKHIRL